MGVNFHPRARDEVEEAQAWYEERSLLAAAGFLHEISVAVTRIVAAPNRYPASLHCTRRIRLERFPFGIHYRVHENDIVVVAVAHQKRRPGYWAGRQRAV
jgi:plasmid stabilization system protein ParE